MSSCIVLCRDGKYTCVCGDTWSDIEETYDHMSSEYDGFCINGMKHNVDTNRYECLCGKRDMDRGYAKWTHFYENRTNCFARTLKIKNSYCDVCQLQCESIAAYKRHIETKSHYQKVCPTDLPLECTACNIKCSSQAQIKAHLETKKHNKIMTLGTHIPLLCDTCNIKCTSQAQIKAHLQTKKHAKLLRINDISESISAQETNE